MFTRSCFPWRKFKGGITDGIQSDQLENNSVQRPNTYTEAVNQDGSKTFTAAPGTVYQPGTPQNAANFNNAEEALTEYAVAFDWMATLIGSLQMEVDTMREQLDALV